jgi:hypothetical protein
MMEAQANPCRLRCCPDQEGRILTIPSNPSRLRSATNPTSTTTMIPTIVMMAIGRAGMPSNLSIIRRSSQRPG